MGNLTNALQELQKYGAQARQARVESIDQAISVIASLNGSGTVRQANQPTRIISAASRRKMARAQRARWARAKNGSQPAAKTAGLSTSEAHLGQQQASLWQEDCSISECTVGKVEGSTEAKAT